MSWFVYLLKCSDDTFYCGITTEPGRRLAEHNGERPGGARYTSGRRPVLLVGLRQCADRAEASRLERQVKSLPRALKFEFFERRENTLS